MESSEEVDAFTAEYNKILKQLPSMLETADPMPPHLQKYMKSSKRRRTKQPRHHHHHKRHTDSVDKEQFDPMHSNNNNDDEHYPPLITDSYFNLEHVSVNPRETPSTSTSTRHSKHSHSHSSSKHHSRKRTTSHRSSTRQIRRHHKYHIEESPKYLRSDEIHSSSLHRQEDDDIVTIEELKRINAVLSSTAKREAPRESKLARPVVSSEHDLQHACTQTDEVQCEQQSECKATQTESVEAAPVKIQDTKINQLISKLSNEVSDKSQRCSELEQDNIALENELKVKQKEVMELSLAISSWKQQMEDQQIYCNNLIKHLDEKSRNEALLRKEINEQQKQLESAHIKLQQHLGSSALAGSTNNEIKELRESLIISEQKCLDWKKKWKQQCYKLEQYESEKVMNQHRIDQQLAEYQKIIQDFRAMMQNNLNSVNLNFANLQKENALLKQENEKLLFELGKIQETTFSEMDLKQNLNEKNNEIKELTKKLTTFQHNLQYNHLNGTMDKSVQCILFSADDENGRSGYKHGDAQSQLINQELNEISVEIYRLSINLQSKSFDIMNEYGFKSLTNSPKASKDQDTMNEMNRMHDAEDTEDVDKTSIIINCKKRFHEIKHIL
eukprot:CAMPEP_0197025700 /NCGR_PEP_ID=MMETSP1384-20130603/5944_1 /TAXON_ID=29189 /ORGANISM="Ammonia sp." /LENGTH=612 /DNA_ID=CAMNT_0042454261 /DNA_START=32 /DNA_END=1867 /DNA_ORIENTATION=-